MYFVECGRHLAAGYVDHPPLVPLVARVACALGDCGVGALRLGPLVARVVTVALTVLLVRRLGGKGFAQWIAGLAVILAPAFLRMGKILCIPVFEPVFWTGGTLLLLDIARGASPRLWLAVGAIAGAGLLNKHTMLVWGLGAAVGAIVVAELRATLRTRWPWLGAALAIAMTMPNVVWQAQNDFATVEFLRQAQAGMLAQIPRVLFLSGQLLYMHPFAALLWIPALWVAATRAEPAGRIFGAIFAFGLVTFLVTRGKPYYLAPAYPPLFALGAVLWERRLQGVGSRLALVLAQVATGVATAVLTLPYLPLPTIDAKVGQLFGKVVPPIALTHDLHDEYGWREQAESVARGWRSAGSVGFPQPRLAVGAKPTEASSSGA